MTDSNKPVKYAPRRTLNANAHVLTKDDNQAKKRKLKAGKKKRVKK